MVGFGMHCDVQSKYMLKIFTCYALQCFYYACIMLQHFLQLSWNILIIREH